MVKSLDEASQLLSRTGAIARGLDQTQMWHDLVDLRNIVYLYARQIELKRHCRKL
jgi:hypothetical protein